MRPGLSVELPAQGGPPQQRADQYHKIFSAGFLIGHAIAANSVAFGD